MRIEVSGVGWMRPGPFGFEVRKGRLRTIALRERLRTIELRGTIGTIALRGTIGDNRITGDD